MTEDSNRNKLESSDKKDNEGKSASIQTEGLSKSFVIGKEPYPVLNNISIEIFRGDFTIIYGPSGSGKSTLLNCLLGLEPPSSGKIWVGGERIDSMTEDERSEMRAVKFGVVYQQPIWVKSLSVLENVALPLLIAGVEEKNAYKRAASALNVAGIEKLKRHRPTEISGGQQQRASLARALVHNPHVVVLDEPTGNLDSHSADEVMMLLQELNRGHDRTIIMVTHNLSYLPYANRTICIKDGKVDKVTTNIEDILAELSAGGKR